MVKVTSVGLCGGQSARPWPLTRPGLAKPSPSLTGNESLFHRSKWRPIGLIAEVIQMAKPFIGTGVKPRFLSIKQVYRAGVELVAALLEPAGRNAAFVPRPMVQTSRNNPALKVILAEQAMIRLSVFTQVMRQTIYKAEGESIVALGITANECKGSNGCIKTQVMSITRTVRVQRFAEKPDLAILPQVPDPGDYSRDACTLLLGTSIWQDGITIVRSGIDDNTLSLRNKEFKDHNFICSHNVEFRVIPSESYDYYVLDHCPRRNLSIETTQLDASWINIDSKNAAKSTIDNDEQGDTRNGVEIFITSNWNNHVPSTRLLRRLNSIKNLITAQIQNGVLVSDKIPIRKMRDTLAQLQTPHGDGDPLRPIIHRTLARCGRIAQLGKPCEAKSVRATLSAGLNRRMLYNSTRHWDVFNRYCQIANGNQNLLPRENQVTCILTVKSKSTVKSEHDSARNRSGDLRKQC